MLPTFLSNSKNTFNLEALKLNSSSSISKLLIQCTFPIKSANIFPATIDTSIAASYDLSGSENVISFSLFALFWGQTLAFSQFIPYFVLRSGITLQWLRRPCLVPASNSRHLHVGQVPYILYYLSGPPMFLFYLRR